MDGIENEKSVLNFFDVCLRFLKLLGKRKKKKQKENMVNGVLTHKCLDVVDWTTPGNNEMWKF